MRFRILHYVDQATINAMYALYAPVFILSTGRSGTKWLAALLNQAANVTAYHEPRPTLQYFSNFAYHHQHDQNMLTKMFEAARMELILEVYNHEKLFVEANQCLTFFAPVISELLPNAKFVHVVRHPGDFVRSAIRKGWHKNDSIWESGRVKMADQTAWEQLSHIEKLSWLWQTTNQFVEDLKHSLGQERIITVKMEEICTNKEALTEFVQFVGAQGIDREHARTLQKEKINELWIGSDEPPNMQKMVSFPEYRDWDCTMQRQLQSYTQDLAAWYGYAL